MSNRGLGPTIAAIAIATPADATALSEFNAKHGVRARIDSVETPVMAVKDVATLGKAQ